MQGPGCWIPSCTFPSCPSAGANGIMEANGQLDEAKFSDRFL